MVVPKYHELMLPILEFSKDGTEKSSKETREYLEDYFNLSDEDRNEKISSGQLKISNRTGWARSTLKKAGFLESTEYAHLKITKLGLEVLNKNYERLTRPIIFKILEEKSKENKQYKELFENFKIFIHKTDNSTETNIESGNDGEDLSPQEIIQNQIDIINNQLADELYETIMNNSPRFFEDLVVKLLIKMGYGGLDDKSGHVTPYTNDGGIDGIIDEDVLGLSQIHIQAKRHKKENKISNETMKNFAWTVEHNNPKGVFITTSSFTKGAIDVANESSAKIILIDGEKLTKLMIEYGLGVSTEHNFSIKKIDRDFFEED